MITRILNWLMGWGIALFGPLANLLRLALRWSSQQTWMLVLILVGVCLWVVQVMINMINWILIYLENMTITIQGVETTSILSYLEKANYVVAIAEAISVAVALVTLYGAVVTVNFVRRLVPRL